MQHTSTFDLMVGNACIQQFDVMAEIFRDSDGDWCVSAVYADALEIDGQRTTNSRDWVPIHQGHCLHDLVVSHFEKDCKDAIDDRWDRHAWRYMPPRSLISAGREM